MEFFSNFLASFRGIDWALIALLAGLLIVPFVATCAECYEYWVHETDFDSSYLDYSKFYLWLSLVVCMLITITNEHIQPWIGTVMILASSTLALVALVLTTMLAFVCSFIVIMFCKFLKWHLGNLYWDLKYRWNSRIKR